MNLSTALLAFLCVASAVHQASATVAFPNLEKKDDKMKEEYHNIAFQFKVKKDTDDIPEFTPRDTAVLEEDLLLAANDSYSSNVFVASEATLKEISIVKDETVFSSSLAIDEDGSSSKTGNLRSGVDQWFYRYFYFYGYTSFRASYCDLCGEDDDDLPYLMLAEDTESIMEEEDGGEMVALSKKNKKKKNKDKVTTAKWAKSFCEKLGTFEDFDGAVDCQLIVLDDDKKVHSLSGEGEGSLSMVGDIGKLFAQQEEKENTSDPVIGGIGKMFAQQMNN